MLELAATVNLFTSEIIEPVYTELGVTGVEGYSPIVKSAEPADPIVLTLNLAFSLAPVNEFKTN